MTSIQEFRAKDDMDVEGAQKRGWWAEAVALIACLALIGAPVLGPSAFQYALMFVALTNVALAVSWTIFGGYTGYYNFGPPAFFGVGAYTVAVLFGQIHVNPYIALPVGFVLAGVFAAFVGIISLRIRGPYFSLFTLFMVFALMTLINAVSGPLGGAEGLELPFIVDDPSRGRAIFQVLAVSAAALSIGSAVVVERSRLLLGLNAIRDDEDVAEAMGVPTAALKIIAFSLSCALMGLVGGIYALWSAFIEPGTIFNLFLGITAILAAVIGGLRNWMGPVVGALLLVTVDYGTRFNLPPGTSQIAYGLLLILAVMFFPSGIVGTVLTLRNRRLGRRLA